MKIMLTIVCLLLSNCFMIAILSSNIESLESIEIDSLGSTQHILSSIHTNKSLQQQNETFGHKLLRLQANRYSLIAPGQTKSDAVGVRVKNPNNEGYQMYWYNHNNGDSVYNGPMKPKHVKSTNSYIGHTFYFTKMNSKEEIYRFSVQPNVNMYLIPFDSQTGDLQLYLKLKEEFDFNSQYLLQTGRPCVSNYPRSPPILPIWPAQYVGQIHSIKSNSYFWNCLPKDDSIEEKKINVKKIKKL